MKNPVIKVADDMIVYLQEIKKLSDPLDTFQRKSLAAVLSVLMMFLVAFKKQNKLGLWVSPVQPEDLGL